MGLLSWLIVTKQGVMSTQHSVSIDKIGVINIESKM